MKAEIIEGVLYIIVEHITESNDIVEWVSGYECQNSEIELCIPLDCMTPELMREESIH